MTSQKMESVASESAEPVEEGGANTRRRLLRRGGLLAAGAALATAALGAETAKPAAAASGDALLVGDYGALVRNLAEDATTLRYDGPSPAPNGPGSILLVEDTEYVPTETNFPSAIAGWVGGTTPPTLSTGVYGWTGVDGGTGVAGRAAFVGSLTNPGSGTGVYGDAASTRGIGVRGVTRDGGIGVRGEALGNSIATAGTGVHGLSNAENGVIGESHRSGAIDSGLAGVLGFSTGIDGVGVLGSANTGVNAIGVWGRSFNGFAGFFQGKVRVTGFIEKLGGGFKIDHPLDPANQFLVHSFVESPDMKNIYDGTVTTDAQGTAVVTLPTYFEALNRDVRYQLTVIGQFAQAIVASEVQQNSFTIKTDKPQVRVSWQVTGIRKDPYAEQHRLVPEEPKLARERGRYLTPELYGQPRTAGIGYAPEPEPLRVSPAPVGPTRTNR